MRRVVGEIEGLTSEAVEADADLDEERRESDLRHPLEEVCDHPETELGGRHGFSLCGKLLKA
jgi:hypothetical protein